MEKEAPCPLLIANSSTLLPLPCHSGGLDVLLTNRWVRHDPSGKCPSVHPHADRGPDRDRPGQGPSFCVLPHRGLTAAGNPSPSRISRRPVSWCRPRILKGDLAGTPPTAVGSSSRGETLCREMTRLQLVICGSPGKLISPIFLALSSSSPLPKNAIQRIVFQRIALEILIPFYSLHSHSSEISEC